MSICGIAVRAGGRPVQEQELNAMRLRLASGLNKADARVVRDGGFCSSGSTSSIWSCDSMLVACDMELCNLERPMETSATVTAEWIGGLYLSDGPSFVEKLRGAFSIAIWDRQARTLMLAVDRFGVQRLCYAVSDSGIVFAGQPSGILASGRIPKKASLSAITDYLVYNVVPIPKTAFEGITRVAPGQYVLWTDKGASTKVYWDMHYPEDARGSSHALAEELLSRMTDAVRVTSAQLDPGKTGCFLSGGTDSSSIVGLLTQSGKSPVNAFSIGFSEDRFNELEYARLAAKHFQARHVEGSLGPDEAFEVVHKITAAYDEPFGNSSAIPTYWCAKLARERGIDVLLAGDGGDELFGGNERYREHEIFYAYQRIPRLLRRWIIEPAVFHGPQLGIVPKIQNYVRRSNTGNPELYCRWRLLRVFSPEVVLGNGMPFRNGHSDLLAAIRGHYQRANASSELNRLLYADIKMTLGDDDLPKVTQTAELAGVRVRFPYLDHQLAEFSGRLPASLKVRRLEKRYLFKLATKDLLPQAILQKKKHGFGLPIGFWLKSNPRWHGWAKGVLFDARTYQRGYFRRDFIEQLFENMAQDDTPYFGDLLWVFLMLELWHRQHVEGTAC